MKKEMREKILKNMANTSQGEAVKDLIDEKIAELDSVRTIIGIPSEEKTIILTGRQLAIKKLIEIKSKLKKRETLPTRVKEQYE